MNIFSKFNLAALAMVSAGVLPVLADDVFFYSGDLYYKVLSESDKTVGVVALPEEDKTYSGNVVIPSQVSNNDVEYTVVSVGELAFNFSPIQSVTLPSTLETIESQAFFGCQQLTSLTVPQSVTKIGTEAFAQCFKLAEAVLPDNMTSVPDCLFQACEKLSSVNIPSGVTVIGEWAFNGCDALESVVIPDKVTSLGQGVFYNCSGLKDVKLGSGLVEIGPICFSGCTSLTEVNIPKSVNKIEAMSFNNCNSLAAFNVDAENEVYSSHDGVLYNKDMSALLMCPPTKTSVTIPEQTVELAEGAFYYAKIEKIEGAENLEKIGNNCFDGASALKSFPFGSKIKEMGSMAFAGAGFEKVVLPESLTTMYDRVFSMCPELKEVTIDCGVTSIPGYCFFQCEKLEKVVFGKNVSYIGEYAFRMSKAIVEIETYATTPPRMQDEDVFSLMIYDNASVIVPEGTLEDYKQAEVWSKFKNINSAVSVAAIESADTPVVYAEGRDIIIDGQFDSASVYSTDGRMAATFKGNVCSVSTNGTYIVSMQTPAGVRNVKIFVK